MLDDENCPSIQMLLGRWYDTCMVIFWLRLIDLMLSFLLIISFSHAVTLYVEEY